LLVRRRMAMVRLSFEMMDAYLAIRKADPAGAFADYQTDIDRLNGAIQRRVEASGTAWFATTLLGGRKVLRINIESFRTTRADIDRTLDAVIAAARAEDLGRPGPGPGRRWPPRSGTM